MSSPATTANATNRRRDPRRKTTAGAAVAALALAGLVLAGCSSSTTTSLRVVVTWSGLTVDQLEFSVLAAAAPQSQGDASTGDAGRDAAAPSDASAISDASATTTDAGTTVTPPTPVATGATILPPTPRPLQPSAPLASGADVIIDLKDNLDGTRVDCRVSALLKGVLQQVGDATAAVTIRRGQVVVCNIALPAGPVATDQANGAGCFDHRQCTSQLCVDGLCCDRACDGTCQACDLPASPGTCSPIPAGAPPRTAGQCQDQGAASCAADGLCDGQGACRKYPHGTACAAGTCSGSSITGGKICDGLGTCAVGPDVTCAPFLCDATAAPPSCLPTCTTSAQCVSGRTCQAGSCGKRQNGGLCATGDQCQSAMCADGVCCDLPCDGACVACNQVGSIGTCRSVAAGVNDPHGVCQNSRATDATSCGDSGVCDGNGACAMYAAESLCMPAVCNAAVLTRAGTCDGLGVCQPGAAVSCDPFGCRNGRCNATCAADSDCADGQTCTVSIMSCGLKGIGQACAAAADCNSGFCVDGLCCSEACDGPCRSCALSSSPGICKNVAAGAADPRQMCAATDVSGCGADGLCDGNGACRNYPPATVCAAPACAGSTGMLASTCNSQAICVAGAAANCAPYRCNGTGCYVSCGTDAECLAPYVCLGGACGLKPNGAACQLSDECQSASCTDGVCCQSSTCGSCQACNVAGSPGRCTPVPALAADPRQVCRDAGAAGCGTDSLCDGAGACHRYAAGTVCAGAACAGSTLTQPASCDGAGTCVAGTKQSCAPFVCDVSGTSCKLSCSVAGDCIPPNQCMASSCGLKPQGTSCAAAGECASGFCTDGVCCGQSTCGSCTACNVAGKPGTCQNVVSGAVDPLGMCRVDAPASCGQNGKCDGGGRCQLYAPGTVCLAASCAAATLTPASTCSAAGLCVPPSATSDCTPYACGNGTCGTSCAQTGDCASPYSCLGSVCKKEGQGANCTAGNQCTSGNCVDGVCCGSSTCPLCQACNVAGFAGTCADVGAGVTEPRAGCRIDDPTSCGLDGTCDGGGACRYYPAGTTCAPATCSAAKKSQNPKTCDGAGSCVKRGMVNCAPNSCDTTTGACP